MVQLGQVVKGLRKTMILVDDVCYQLAEPCSSRLSLARNKQPVVPSEEQVKTPDDLDQVLLP